MLVLLAVLLGCAGGALAAVRRFEHATAEIEIVSEDR